MLEQAIIKRIFRRFGKEIRIPSDYVELSSDIQGKTGDVISVNTLKRLLGNINEQRKPRLATLDIIARYLGAKHWDDYLYKRTCPPSSAFLEEDSKRNFQFWEVNDKIEFHYSPDRILTLEYIGDFKFKVLISKNSKLILGDELLIKRVCLYHSLTISNVIRNGENLGEYFAGRLNDIVYLGKRKIIS